MTWVVSYWDFMLTHCWTLTGQPVLRWRGFIVNFSFFVDVFGAWPKLLRTGGWVTFVSSLPEDSGHWVSLVRAGRSLSGRPSGGLWGRSWCRLQAWPHGTSLPYSRAGESLTTGFQDDETLDGDGKVSQDEIVPGNVTAPWAHAVRRNLTWRYWDVWETSWGEGLCRLWLLCGPAAALLATESLIPSISSISTFSVVFWTPVETAFFQDLVTYPWACLL